MSVLDDSIVAILDWANIFFEFVCVTLTLSFFLFCCVPYLHVRARSLLRPWVVYHVENGLYWVALLQKYRTPSLTTLFEQSSHSVSVGFYGSFLPLLMWEGFPGLGSELCMLMAATLYVGNAMKDLVSAPRPLGLKYEKVRLSHISTSSEETKKNAEEYGLPSSHTMNSLCLNFYICHYLHRNDFLSNDMAIFWYTVVFLWVVWIAISRLYLGLHTPIDILAGAIAGLTVLTAFISVQDRVHQFMFSSNSWIFMIILSLILLRLHPMPEKPTPTYEFTTSFVGVAFGVIVAIHQYPAYYEEGITLGKISSLPILIHIVRVASGFGIVLLSKSVMKRVCTTILPLAYYGFPLAIRRLWQPPVHGNIDPKTSLKRTMNDRQWVDVDATVRFFSYASIGFSACYVVPKTFDIVHYLFVYYF